MGCRDHGHERFLLAPGWARARRRRGQAGVKAGDEKATAECHSLIMSYTSHTNGRRSSHRLRNADATDPDHGFDARGLNLSSAKSDQWPLLFCCMSEVKFLVAGCKAYAFMNWLSSCLLNV